MLVFWADMSEMGSGSASGASFRFLFFLFFSFNVYWELEGGRGDEINYREFQEEPNGI